MATLQTYFLWMANIRISRRGLNRRAVVRFAEVVGVRIAGCDGLDMIHGEWGPRVGQGRRAPRRRGVVRLGACARAHTIVELGRVTSGKK
jgi:hypothetical protein